ncbi:MAG: 50S ribosomal protein L6 [Phycisphaeraceae bacterium]|nr:50S ribosomal protein L6 [Phycisphaeraceae bacterium]
MSRIGKKPVPVPAGVKVSIGKGSLTIEGPKGKLDLKVPHQVSTVWSEGSREVEVSLTDGYTPDDKAANALWGTTRAHIRNMIDGVTKGFERRMEVVGVGWTAAVTGNSLKMTLGFANPIIMPVPAGLTVKVDKQIVSVSGPDKQLVGQFASAMRSKRKPEPYNGKGVKYVEEVIVRKQGKQFGA